MRNVAGGFAERVLAVSLLWLLSASAPVAADCDQAQALVDRALSAQARQGIALLTEAIRLCPNHAEALNNLGVIREQAGDLEQAESLYRRAIAADPEFPLAYAGIGDLLMARGRYAQAAEAYDGFLTRMERARRRGRFADLDYALPQYRTKRDQALANAAPAREEFSAERIARSLTAGGNVRMRSIGARYKSNASIDLPIHFEFNSATVDAGSMRLAAQLAEALRSPALRGSRIRIEGHTDSVGSAAFNQRLSEKRAAAVRRLLVERFGLAPDRFETRGYGESRPVAYGATEADHAANRRVTFVNLGAGG